MYFATDVRQNDPPYHNPIINPRVGDRASPLAFWNGLKWIAQVQQFSFF